VSDEIALVGTLVVERMNFISGIDGYLGSISSTGLGRELYGSAPRAEY
jgi:hypothetical protein